MSELGKTTSRSRPGVNGRHTAANTVFIGGRATAADTIIQGSALNRLVRRATPSQKGIIAADLRVGRLVMVNPTWRQALDLANASSGYAHTASKRSTAERVAVIDRGESLSAWHATPNVFVALTKAMGDVMREFPDDADVSVGVLVERLVARFPEQVLAALDRATAPELPFEVAA